jgi:hypothetical protein
MDNNSKLLKKLSDIDKLIEKINDEIIIIQNEDNNDLIIQDLITQKLLWKNMKLLLIDFYVNR